jgi:hypothetical protein
MIERVRPAHRLGVWLAITALLIQSWLPLADAALHHHWRVADATASLAAFGPDDHATALTQQPPAHAPHDCPICEFIASLGSFSPPTAVDASAPTFVRAFAIWPTAPPAVRVARAFAAQPRAPPTLI